MVRYLTTNGNRSRLEREKPPFIRHSCERQESSVFDVKGLKTLDPSLRWGDGVIRGSLQGHRGFPGSPAGPLDGSALQVGVGRQAGFQFVGERRGAFAD